MLSSESWRWIVWEKLKLIKAEPKVLHLLLIYTANFFTTRCHSQINTQARRCSPRSSGWNRWSEFSPSDAQLQQIKWRYSVPRKLRLSKHDTRTHTLNPLEIQDENTCPGRRIQLSGRVSGYSMAKVLVPSSGPQDERKQKQENSN